MTNQTTPATKEQLDGLIRVCLENGYNDEAGLLQLASDSISAKVKAETEEPCACFEVMGDNKDCPKHGDMFETGPTEADYEAWNDEQNRLHYEMLDSQEWDRERNDLYVMGMGG